MATVGREGMVGIGIPLGGEHALGRYVVPVSGFAHAIEKSRLRSALRAKPELRAACETYAQAFVAHLLQNVCNATHGVEQRCVRWLLMCADQTENATFELTQEYLAETGTKQFNGAVPLLDEPARRMSPNRSELMTAFG
jgi:hypothetical protein